MEDDQKINALQPGELDIFIECTEPSQIDFLGSKRWIESHQRLQKLQQQAVIEAGALQEELTKDAIISYGKIPLLLHEAICVSVWRQMIFPKILEMKQEMSNNFLLYAVMYHETVAVGLLELVLYDEEACAAISDILVDLVDYCMEMITGLIGYVNSGYLQPVEASEETNRTPSEELLAQQKDLCFDIGIRCITIIGCLTNVLEKIHVSASSRLYGTHDCPLLLTELLQQEPWQKRDSQGNFKRYNDGKWKLVAPDDEDQICRTEALCWLALWRLILNPSVGHHYEMNNCRKTNLCKLIYRITDLHMDQIPMLADLKRSLGQLGVADISLGKPVTSRPMLIEVVPQIKPAIMKKIERKSKNIAKTQLENFFKPNPKEMMELAKMLSSSYTSEVMEHLDDGGAKCARCGDKAAKKCSRCKSEWYCGRECQVKCWSKHKDICDQLALVV